MDDDEFERFVKDHQEKALRLAHSFLDDWEEARDAVQEAFCKAYRGSGGFRGEARATTWFHQIVANHCRDRLRRRRYRPWLAFWRSGGEGGASDVSALEEVEDPAPHPAEQAEQRAFRAALSAALARLPRRQGEVFRLKAFAGLTLSEIASTLGLAEGTVKAHLFRSTRALQEALEPWREIP